MTAARLSAVFLLLHCACFASHVATLIILFTLSWLDSGDLGWLIQAIGLLALQVSISFVCSWTAWKELKSRQFPFNRLCLLPLLPLLGLGQLIQPWLAWKELRAGQGAQSHGQSVHRYAQLHRGRVMQTAPPRFSCSGVEAVAQGAAFAAVALCLLTGALWTPSELDVESRMLLWVCAGLSLLSACLALVEMDISLSDTAAATLSSRPGRAFPLHFGLRAIEVLSRVWVWAVLMSLLSTEPLPIGGLHLLPLLLLVDYLLTALTFLGGQGGQVVWLLALGAMVANLAEDSKELSGANGSEAAPAAEVPKAEAEVGEPIEAKATDAGNSAEAKDVKEVKFLLPAKGNLPEAPMAPADHLYGASVDLKNAYANGRLLKRGPIYGYMFQPRWCVLTNSQLIIYKDEHLSQRQSAERFTEQMTATRFSCHDAPGEAVKHKSEKPYGFVFDSVPLAGKARKLSYFDAENEEMLTQWLQAFKQAALRRKEAVTLHFYDMVMGSTQGEGSVQPLGTGNFHVGIEINGFEWSYGFSELGTGGSKPNEQCVLQVTQDACGLWASCPSLHTKAPLKSKQQQEAQCVCCLYLGDFVSAVPGVFSSKPTHCVPHSYRDAVELGYSTLNESEIEEHISKLKDQWPGSSYDLLKNNCSNFCHTLCEALGVSIPPWILRLSSAEVLGQNLPAEKGRRGRGSAIIIAAQALDQ
ncbi:unnamed protein product [Durusdinium trenchii]|uniref:Uncharacterized protein n=1 Tax=Durusdinium trenchii TaxID=1381693 RepID=A0ABP0ILW7_9DINO